MSEPRGQLRKEHLPFPGCSHFRRLDDNHEKCQSCMYGGAPGCTRLSRCHFCADWTSSMWDAEERNRQAAVKRRIRKKDKKASASSTGEPTRPGYESSSEVSRPVTHLRLTALRVGTLGRGRPRRSIPEMRHGLSMDAPRHGAVMALTRIGLSLFALHPRPLVMRYGWSGLAPRHQCAMKGWSLLALLQFHMVRRGPQGLTLSLTTMREASLAMTSLVMMNSPRGFRDPVLNTVVMMTSCWLRHLALLSHHSRCIVLRIIPVELVSFAIGKRRVPQGPYPPVMVSPVGLGRAIRVLLRPLVMRTVVGCDVPGLRRCPPLIRKVLSGWTRIMPMNPVLWNPSTFLDRMERTSRWWVRTYRPSRCWFPRFLSWTNLLLRPVRQDSRHQILNLPWGNLWIWWSFAQSQSVAAQRTPVTPVTGLTRQPAVPQKEILPPAVAVDNHPVESSTEVSASVSKHRSRTRTRSRKHRERRVERSRSSLVTSPSSRLSPSISGETIQYQIGCRDPLRLEVRDGGRRVSIPDGNSHQRKNLSHDSRRTSRSRSRSPLRTESSSRRTSRSARSCRERRHSQSSTSRQRMSDDDGSDIMVSPSRYSIFRNAVSTSRGAYTSVNPRGEGLAKASMVHLSQDDKPEKVAWSVQPQLWHAIDHVSILAQGVKKIDKVAKTPLCEQSSSLRIYSGCHVLFHHPLSGTWGWESSNPQREDHHSSRSLHEVHNSLCGCCVQLAGMLFWTICCWTSRRLPEPGQHHFQGHIWWVQIPIGFTRRSWNSESNRCFMVGFQPTSGIQQHLVLLSPGLCGVVTKATTDLEVLVPGGGNPFVGPPRLLDRVSSRDSPVNSEDNLSSKKDEEDPTGEVAEVVPTGMNLRLENLPLPLVIETLRVGAHLTNFVHQWQNLLGDCCASRTFGNGVQLEWESLSPLTRTPISFSTRNTPKDLQTAVDKLLSKGAIEPVFRPETKGFFSRLFLVPKKTGDLRPVIDLSRLNDHLVIPRFKMETQASVRASIRENE